MNRGSEICGIDFGTTYSCIAMIGDDGYPYVVADLQGNRTTPSVVALDDKGKWIVGRAAKALLGKDPDNVVAFIKREMFNYDFKCNLQGEEFTLEKISSQILKFLVNFANKKRLEKDEKRPITDVVFSYPAYWGGIEKGRILHALRMAGLNVLRGINEPMAAVLSYGCNQREGKVVLVYHLGGATFDVSIIKNKNGMPECLSARGDHHLGGADWDRAIVDMALEQIGAKWDDLDKATQGMLMNAAEETKKIISNPDEEESVLAFNYNGVRNVTIRRSDFEARTASLMQPTKGYVQEALDAARMQPFDVDEVILVGGSSYMPMVSRMVEGLFPDSDVKMIDPDVAVAKGAAIYGSLIASEYRY